ncbi:MAG: deoxyadenosine/deoxycytidine kinase [Candidatus Azotimanducaceae bacterium]
MSFLSRKFGIQPFYEPNDENPYLPSFYEDMPRWAFHSQIYFLSNKFRIHREFDRADGVVVLDRTIFEDAEIFATALHEMGGMDDRDFRTYWDFYQTILETIQPPDLLIYVKCSMKTLRSRIRQRGRAMEQDIPLSYLKRLDRLYDDWIDGYQASEVLVLDTEKLDYDRDLIYQLELIKKIEAILR